MLASPFVFAFAAVATMLLGSTCRVTAFAPRGLGHTLPLSIPRPRCLATTTTTTTEEAEAAVVAAAREVAVAAARSTGDEVRRGMGADIAQTKANFRDLLTEVRVG